MTDLYKKFYIELWEDHKLKKEDIIDYKYVGWFSLSMAKEGIYVAEDRLGERYFDAVLGHKGFKISDFYEFCEEKCVCKVDILYNHIIVKDIEADELEFLILGSECIDKFCNIEKDRKCSICDVKIKNSKSGKCAECRKKRFCIECNDILPKGKRGQYCCLKCEYASYSCLKCNKKIPLGKSNINFCSNYCENPKKYCKCNRKKKYHWSKECVSCYYEK